MKRFKQIVDDVATPTKKNHRVLTRLERSNRLSTGLERGHAIMDAVLYTLEKLDSTVARSDDQVIVHMHILVTLCPFVYGNDLYGNEDKIKARYGFTCIETGVLFTAPRRFGKTWCLAMMIAVVFHCIRGVVISIISHSKLSSGNDLGILGKIMNILETQLGHSKFKRNNANSVIAVFGEGDVRKIHSFSASIGDGYVLLLCYIVLLLFQLVLCFSITHRIRNYVMY